MLKEINGFPPIWEESWEEAVMGVSPQVKRSVAMMGGAISMLVTAELISHFKATGSRHVSVIEKYEGKGIIMVISDIMEQLTSSEQEAILLHEKAHILLGHIEPKYQADLPKINGVVSSTKMEKEADRYAASFVGKEVVASSIKGMTEATIKNIFCRKELRIMLPFMTVGGAIGAVMKSDPIVERLAALQ